MMAAPPTTTPTTVRIPSIFRTTPTTAYKAPHVPHAIKTVAHHPALAVATVAAVVAAFFIVKEWQKRRTNQVDRVLATMAAVLGVHSGTEDHHVKKRGGGGKPATRWRRGKLVMVRASYPRHAIAHPKARAEMVRALSDLLSVDVDCEWNTKKGTVKMSVVAAVQDSGTIDQLRSVFGHALEDAKVVIDTYSPEGLVSSFTVTYGPTHLDADEGWRVKTDAIVCSKTARAWVSQWSPSTRKVTYRLRAELPNVVLHPVIPVERDQLPFGVTASGTVTWDLSESPHCLVVGRAGRGKSVVIRGLAMEACRPERSIDVRIVDPKKISLLALRKHPGITEFAVTEADMVDTIHRVFLEVEDRNTRYFNDLATKQELCRNRVLLIVDETWELIRRLNAAHAASDAKGKVHPAIEDLFAIARTGREIGVHLLAGMQRPDASMLSGEGRNNFGVRIALGNLDRDARKMVGAEGLVLTKARGRAEVCEEGEPSALCQAYWTPDPSERLTPAESACLADLGAPVTPVATIQTPLPAVLSMGTPMGTSDGHLRWALDGHADGHSMGTEIFVGLSEETIRRIGELDDEGNSERAIAAALEISKGVVGKYKRIHRAERDGPRLHVVPDDEST